MKNFVLAGNPNSGKTTLFNSLTGSTAHVGNWPGVTVDKKEGLYKKGKEVINIMDLPGIYSLSPYTPEEVISRNYILNENVDCIINIVDVTNLERNLYLTTQLMEVGVPIVIALNMMDVFKANGDVLDVKELQKRIGLPVVEISALKEENLDDLMEVAYQASFQPRKAKTILQGTDLKHLIKDCTTAFSGLRVSHPLFHAIKLIELDDLECNDHPHLVAIVDAFKQTYEDKTFGNDLEAVIADSRYRYITENLSVLKIKGNKNADKNNMTKSERIDKVLTNKWASIPIFLAIMFLIFHFTFSENLFYLGFLFKDINPSFAGTAFEGMIWSETGINSIGCALMVFIEGLSTLLSQAITSGLASLNNTPEWVNGLLIDGILSGVFSVLSFLPQILCLFLMFSILEDSGYMSRVAFILDKIFRKFGLSGRAFMPMIMGFGCSVPAMINTRTLADEKERVATIRVIPFFSCGAKLPILTAIAGAIVSMSNVNNVDIITYSMYLVGIITAIISVLLMRKTTLKGDVPPFIMELPSYRMPQFKSLMLHLWDKAKHFIKKAFTIILASSIIVWALSHFSWSWTFLADEQINESILASIGQLLQPIFTPLGFGSQLGSWGWVFIVSAIVGLIAKENVISTFGVLAACITGAMIDIETDGGDVKAVIEMINVTGISVAGLISFIAFNMTTIPCFATVATAKGELSNKKFRWTIVFWLVVSYIVSSIIYLIGTWWWTSFIVLAVVALVLLLIHLFNKNKIVKV